MTTAGRHLGQATALVAGGAAMAALAGTMAQGGMKSVVLVAGFFTAIIVATILRDLIAVLLVGLLLAISYNRQYFSFDDVFGNYGPGGLYWTPADVVMVAIFAVALAEAAMQRRTLTAVPRRLSVEPAYLLVIFLMAVSAFRVDPVTVSIIETLRIVKYLFMFLLLRSVMNEDRMVATFVALALMTAAQFSIGVLQVALGAGGSGLSDLSAQVGEMAHRATGTLGHPNMYAPFLLTFALGFLTMAAAPMGRARRLIAIGLGLAACLAIVISQSRAPVAALGAAGVCAACELAWRGRLPPLRLIGGGFILVVIGLIAIAPLMDQIMARVTGDFGASVDFRANYNESALSIWRESPIIGVGPMRFFETLGLYNAELAEINATIRELRHEANIKSIAPVHNVYLWLLAEIGVLGLIGFVILLLSFARLFHQAGRGNRPANFFFVGTFWGFVGLMFQQTTDFSFWFDHHMALMTVLAALAGYIRDRGHPA